MPKNIAALLAVLAVMPVFAADQPQWGEARTRNMVSSETGLVDSFDLVSGKNVKWTASLGTQSFATATVAGGKVFIGCNNKIPRNPKHKDDCGVLLCLDEKDGKLIWQFLVPKREGGDPFLDWPETGWCSPATIDGDRVYTVTNRGEVVCLDVNGMANGNDGPYKDEGQHMAVAGQPAHEVCPDDADVIWMTNLITACGIYTHDAQHCSVLVDGPLLYVNTGNGVDNTHIKIRCPQAPTLAVFEKATGKFLAREDENISPNIPHAAWSSPGIGEINGKKLVFLGGANGICYAFEALQGVAPASLPAGTEAGATTVQTLKKVWSFDCDPTCPKQEVHKFRGNKKEGPSQCTGMPVLYKNRIYATAGGDVWQGKRQAWLKCIDATKTGDITTSAEIWSYPIANICIATPAIADGLVYITDCGGMVHCVDAETGKMVWTHQMMGQLWASCMVADGKVYVGSRSAKGDFCILAAGREKKVLCATQLGAEIAGTAAIANGTVYVGTMKKLYALKKSE
ncbi:MAG TPA: PQQ-binding-like beta-propeller repeat protein [Planctomycetota bacterium]|jgi:outer membrane protein assembly factor BamB